MSSSELQPSPASEVFFFLLQNIRSHCTNLRGSVQDFENYAIMGKDMGKANKMSEMLSVLTRGENNFEKLCHRLRGYCPHGYGGRGKFEFPEACSLFEK